MSTQATLSTISTVVRTHPAACTLRLIGGSDLVGAVVLDGDGDTIILTTSAAAVWTVPLENVIAVSAP